MKVKEFIEKLENNEEVNPVKYYIPLQTKRAIVRDVLERNMDDNDGFIKLDRTMADVYFTMSLIGEYFDVEIEDVESDYEAIMAAGFSFDDVIFKDVCRAYKVFDYEEKDLMAQNSIEAQVAKMVNSLTNAISNFDVSKLIPEGTDVNELMELLNKYK